MFPLSCVYFVTIKRLFSYISFPVCVAVPPRVMSSGRCSEMVAVCLMELFWLELFIFLSVSVILS
jgi:hypothetical protein